MTADEFKEHAQLADMMVFLGIASSKGDARRLIQGGGVSVNGEKVADGFRTLGEEDIVDGEIMIKKGKKVFHKIVLK